MEEHVGMIANNPNYKLEALEQQYTSSPTSGAGHGVIVGNENITLNVNSQPATRNENAAKEAN